MIMEGIIGTNAASTIIPSTEQRLLLGNVVDDGGGLDIKNNHRRSPMRVCSFQDSFMQ